MTFTILHHALGIIGAAILSLLLFAALAACAWPSLRRQGAMFIIIAIGFLHAAATKPSPLTRSVYFPYIDPERQYLFDAGSVVSNTHVHVAFATSVVLPPSAPVFLDYAPDGSDSWTTFTNATLAAFPRPLDFDFPGAISNSWMCYTTWTPGPAVHTNGVAQIVWQLPSIDRSTNICAMLNTAIYTNSAKVVAQ